MHKTYLDTYGNADVSTYIKSTCSDKYMVFLYQIKSIYDTENMYCFYVYDPAKQWSCRNSVLSFTSVLDIKIMDEDLYILGNKVINGKETGVLLRVKIKNLSKDKEYKIPDFIQPTMDLAFVDGDVLLNDGNINSEEPNDKAGYIRGTLSEDGQVAVSEQRWFVQPNCGYSTFFMNGAYIFLHYRFPDAAASSELNIFDWSSKDNPKLIQKFYLPLDLTENKVYHDLLIIGNQLYRLKDNQYVKTCDFPEGSDLKALGPSMVLGLSKNELVGYDFSSPDKIQKISASLKMTETFYRIYAAGEYIYYSIQKDSGLALSINDAAIPSNLRQVSELSLESKTMGNLQFHDSLFINTELNTSKVTSYSLMDDGFIGERVATPPLLQDPSITRIGQTVYNDKVYLQGYYYTVPNELLVSDPAYQRFYIYRKSGTAIEQQPVSMVELNINDQTVKLSDRYLLSFNNDKNWEIVNGVNTYVDYNTITLYSIENIERPLLLTKYRIPNSYETVNSQTMALSVSGFVFGPSSIAYISSGSRGESIGIIDIQDPENLKQKLFPVSLSSGDMIRDLQWHKNVLVIKTWQEIIFVQVDNKGQLHEISRIFTGLTANFVMTGNRLYLSKYNRGIDTYQIRFG